MKIILNGIFKENPIFVLVLGLCSSLAVTTTFEKSYMMGLCVLFVIVCSNFLVSLIKKLIPESVKIPVFIVIIATFVTILGVLLEKYVPNLYSSLGVYLSLITVNCLVLGRALSVASKEKITTSILDGIGVGIGFMLSLMLIGLIREILGSNTLTLVNDLSSVFKTRLIYKNIIPFSLPLFITPAGAFFTIGFLLALFNLIRGKKHESH